jgi:hypothetical protein
VLASRWVAVVVADRVGERARDQLGASGVRHLLPGAVVAAREWPQLALQRRELAVEVVDDAQQRPDRLQPDFWDAVLGELVECAGLAQRGDAAPLPPLRLDPERAVDRRRPQADQVCAPWRSRPSGRRERR